MENWARITYREMTNSDDDICNDSEYQFEMNDVSNDISRTTRLDEPELIPHRSNSTISINLGCSNPFEAAPSRCHRKNGLKLTVIIIVCVLFLMTGILIVNRNSGSDAESTICLTQECKLTVAHFLLNMDVNVKPCDDFYQFMCGNWNDNNPRLHFENVSNRYIDQQTKIRKSIELYLEINENLPESKAVKKMRTMFEACMNTTQIDILGLRPMIDYLRQFNLPSLPTAISVNILKNTNVSSNGFEWMKSIAEIKKTTGFDVVIGFDVNSNNHIFLGIPNHFNANDVNADYIAEKISNWVSFVQPNVNLTIIQPLAEESAKKIISVRETFNAFIKDAQNISINAVQNATQSTTKTFDQYLEIIFADTKPKVNFNELLIDQNEADTYYLQKVMEYISKNKDPNNDLELYIWWEIVEKMMSESMATTNEEKNVPRSWYCTEMIENHMAMAATFATFHPEILPKIRKMKDMINGTLSTFTLSTQQFDWMDNKTQRFMLAKISGVKSFVGFPEWIQTDGKLDEFYAGLNFNESTHLINLMNVLKWQMNKKLESLNSRQEFHSWPIQPTEVNASYSFKHNSITIPWTILQYPFYGLGLDALDYGAIGSIIGHELMHVFDNDGRKYDQNGKEHLWWTNKTLTGFNNRSECFIEQYKDFYKSALQIDIDGQLSLNENIADHGGLRGAFYAYKVLHPPGKREILNLPVFEDYTHEQLFFMSYANSLCEIRKRSSLESALKTNGYAPGRFRVNGVLANLDEFSNAFECSPNSKMISNKKCTL